MICRRYSSWLSPSPASHSPRKIQALGILPALASPSEMNSHLWIWCVMYGFVHLCVSGLGVVTVCCISVLCIIMACVSEDGCVSEVSGGPCLCVLDHCPGLSTLFPRSIVSMEHPLCNMLQYMFSFIPHRKASCFQPFPKSHAHKIKPKFHAVGFQTPHKLAQSNFSVCLSQLPLSCALLPTSVVPSACITHSPHIQETPTHLQRSSKLLLLGNLP